MKSNSILVLNNLLRLLEEKKNDKSSSWKNPSQTFFTPALKIRIRWIHNISIHGAKNQPKTANKILCSQN